MPVVRALPVAAFCVAALAAQQVRVVAPIGAIGTPATSASDDAGIPVEMFENPNLDRYLRRAQSFLERRDYSAAIEVLQDVVEGRTVEVVAARPDEELPEAAPPPPPPEEPAPDRGPTPGELDARNAVFSHDGRLYRPVRRLCHELLARMPDVGIEIYRTTYEYAAEELLREAEASGSTSALEQVANRYFVTLPAGQALMLLADRLMHEGRYRSAVQVLRDLLEVYPAANRRQLGIRDVWCRFKIALCLRLAGEAEAARTAIGALAEAHPEESLRILGQLESIRELPSSQLFARDMVAIEAPVDRAGGIRWLDRDTAGLVGLWQYRFRNPEPYRDPTPSKRNRNFFIDGSGRSTAMPFAERYGPATWVAFDVERQGDQVVPRALFLEHYRLRKADAASGLLLQETGAVDEPPVPREGHPRVRIAASDFGLLRPVDDEARRYVVIGHEGNTSSSEVALRASELVAYRRGSWQRAWSSNDWLDGDDGLREVTFLAAPKVFGERLLLPALRRSAYTLECLDRSTGRPLWHTPLHAGGSPFFKAPGVPVVVQGGTAFVATNAGCVAAVDAFAGDLRWIRRYERRDPVHAPERRPGVQQDHSHGYAQQFTQSELPSFEPNDLILHNGVLIVAPCDGEVLLGIDAASGQPVWMLDGRTRYAPYGKLERVLGANDRYLFVTSDTHLVCIELAGGLLRWCEPLPSWSGPKNTGRGRGAVVGGRVIVPGVRELLVFDVDGPVDGRRAMRRLRLPAFGESRDPLQGSYYVVAEGPWLGIGYQGGVEVYSSADALRDLAGITDDPLRKAFYLTRAGESAAAEQVLSETIRRVEDPALRERAGQRLLGLVRERADALARGGDLSAALRVMDAAAELLQDRSVRLNWHLARIEMCKEAGDLRAHETEQMRLYDYMEGRG